MLAGGSEIIRPRGIIGIPRRSTWDPDKAIQVAAMAARGNIHPCPVIHHGKILGMMRGESPYTPRVRFKPTPYRMNYTNYDDLVSEFVTQGKQYQACCAKTITGGGAALTWYDLFTAASMPPAYTLAGAAATAIAFDDTNVSGIRHGGNVSTDTKYLLSITGQLGTHGCLLLYDRVLDYESCVYTAGVNTAMTNVAVAARYVSAGQPGLQLTWGSDTVHNATASTISQLQYTDDDGNPLQAMPTTPAVDIVVSAGATATTIGTRINAPATAGTAVTWGAFMPLAQGDTGARLVDNYTTSAANTGTFVLALVYPLAYVPVFLGQNATMTSTQLDQLFSISAMERVYDGACLSFMYYQRAATAPSTFLSDMTFGWG